MREAIRGICAFVLFVSATTAFAVWFDQQPTPLVWKIRIGAPLLAIAALGWILKMHFQADLLPDYLKRHTPDYFFRQGFAFGFGNCEVRKGVFFLTILFQNQQDQSCIGRIGIRPSRGFF